MGQLQQRLVDFSSNTCSWLRSISSWYKEIIMTNTRGLVSGYLLVAQIVFIVLFGVFVEYDPNHTGPINATIADDQATSNVEDAELYPMFQDVHVMMLIGFGFLMTFLKRHGFGSVGFNFLLTVYVIQWALLVNGWFAGIGGDGGKIQLSLHSFLHADFAVAAILISFGAVLGVTSPTQLLVMATLEVVFYNVSIYVTNGFKLSDVGGSVVIHMFGAYFGLAASFVLGKFSPSKGEKEGSVYHSDIFAMIGTLFLWLFWPSFNAGPATGNDRHRAIINTIMSLSACTSTTFAMSSLLSKENKFDMVHIQNAAIAGGVAMGASADFIVQPYGALLIGTVAGILSVVGYVYIQPALERAIGLHDTCGVHNLHGMPGILGACISAVVASVATRETYFDSYDGLMKRDGQAAFQIHSLLASLAIAIIGGLFTGFVMSMNFLDRMKSEELYEDEIFWEVNTGEYMKRESEEIVKDEKNELQTMA